jgi:hypothetical protein
MLLAIYSDIIKNAHSNLNEKINNKAVVLNRQSIQPRLVKVCFFIIFFDQSSFVSILVKVLVM